MVKGSSDFSSIYSKAILKSEIKGMRKVVDGEVVESLDTVNPEDVKNFTILDGQITVNTKEDKPVSSPVTIKIKGSSNSDIKDALIFVNGKKVANLDNIRPEDIENMSILKGKSATDIYGEEGKNGVILITTKKSAEKSKEEVSVPEMKDALIYVDGVKVANLDNINREDIENITVLKGQAAINQYGEEGKNEVVLITTKAKNSDERNNRISGIMTIEDNDMSSFLSKKGLKDALIIVDGVKGVKLETVYPKNIKNFTILKDEFATDKYGEEGKNGVVVIEMKKN